MGGLEGGSFQCLRITNAKNATFWLWKRLGSLTDVTEELAIIRILGNKSAGDCSALQFALFCSLISS